MTWQSVEKDEDVIAILVGGFIDSLSQGENPNGPSEEEVSDDSILNNIDKAKQKIKEATKSVKEKAKAGLDLLMGMLENKQENQQETQQEIPVNDEKENI